MTTSVPLERYAVLGDLQSAALVTDRGSIDWLSLPRFDAPACFAALLGGPAHGCWTMEPAGPFEAVGRRYLPDTLVLETRLANADGEIAVLDLMPPRGTNPDVVRIVEGRRGRVAVRSVCAPRFHYGELRGWVRGRDDGSVSLVCGRDALVLTGPGPSAVRDGDVVHELTVGAGDRVAFVLTWHASHEPVPAHVDAEAELGATVDWWHEWASACRYDGPARDLVVRSLVTLRALTHRPSGGIVAAATTSLPEEIGGVRNWDYRYCWLRDATFVLDALLAGGYTTEAAAWRDWLLRAAAGEPDLLQVMYGVEGERDLPERELPWLPGYEGSRPVRVGNAAARQTQLDVYGEVADVLHMARRAGVPPEPAAWTLQLALLRSVERLWTEPDHSLWEVRGPRRHFTHSKVMAWVAFDRAIRSVERWGFDGPVERWRRCRQDIHEDVCRNAWSEERQSFVQFYGGDRLDASALLIPAVGFLPATDPRVVATVDAIEATLCRDGFVRRYEPNPDVEGVTGREGAFLACSFWLADVWCLQDRFDEAAALFDRLCGVANDVGLLAEQYDPESGRFLGNFPQAFSHVALVNTAYNLRGGGPAYERSSS